MGKNVSEWQLRRIVPDPKSEKKKMPLFNNAELKNLRTFAENELDDMNFDMNKLSLGGRQFTLDHKT